jgi:pimeloyl-ACP methyl ester carboxylesterase
VPALSGAPSPDVPEPAPAEARQFHLRSGLIAAEISGSPEGHLVIGIPGLSANLRSFDVIFGALDPWRHRRLAYDPRGRGRSEKTPAGSYGWPSHAKDVIEMADQLGAREFDLIGWSMGSWIAMVSCGLAPGRVRRLVVIDAAGLPDAAATAPVYAGLERLGALYPSREAFFELAKKIPMYQPWPVWERLFDYELEDVEGGVRARTSKDAPWEDEAYRKTQDPYSLWPAVTMPCLLIRAEQEIMPGMGRILTKEDEERFLREVPGSRALDVDTNHYAVGVHQDTARAVAKFLDD